MMIRTGWTFLLLLFVSTLHAFDVTVVRSFTISGLTRREGKVIFPVERKQYYNIRALDQETYHFVSSCESACVQTLAEVSPEVVDVRSAKTRQHMWIVQVAFSRAWLVTFLVFEKGSDFKVKPPEHFTFINNELEKKTRQFILQAVRQEEV